MSSPYLTTGQVARCLGLSRHTILRAAQRGEIAVAQRTPGGRLRFDSSAVDVYARRLGAGGSTALSGVNNALTCAPDLLRIAFASMACGVVIRDASGCVADANAAAEHILGLTLDQLRGRPLATALGALTRADGSALPDDERPAVRAARTGQPQRGRLIGLTRPDGTHLWLQLDAVPVPAAGGSGAVVVTFVDVSDRVRAEEALRASEARFRALSEQTSDVISVIDAAGLTRYISPSIQRVLGYDPAELEGQPAFALVHPDDAPDARARFAAHLRTPDAVSALSFRVRHRDGSWRAMEVRATNCLDDPTVQGILVASRDVTDRAQAEEALRASEERFRATFDQAAVGVAHLDQDGRWLRVNERLCTLLGYTRDELLARTFQDLTHPEEDVSANLALIARLRAREIETYTLEKRYRRKDGTTIWATVTVSQVQEGMGTDAYLLAMIEDTTARKQVEAALHHQALHDTLTGLPNRALLHDRLAQALRVAARDNASLALMLLDLDRFKEVNDTLGHEAGDALLRHVAACVRAALRTSDTIARLGGDEFAMVLPGVEATQATRIARTVLAALATPVTIDGHTVVAGGSLGVALYPEHGEDTATLLRHADVAMYAAKRAGGGHAIYTPAHDQHSPHRLSLIAALQQAIGGGELRLYYQPTVDTVTGTVGMVEALARWQHPTQGLLLPESFIPLAESTGLIVPLTRWVLQTAVRQLRLWREGGLTLGVAVNLSARAVHDPDLPAAIRALLEAHDVPATALRVELTESAVMADPASALDVLTRLADLGVRIAIDDFGTGYSSLAYLKRLPVDEIKIDRSFVTTMTTDSDDATIVASTIGLGHSLGLRFVAEGVESRDVWQALEALGCDAAQGFYFSRALPPDELAQWLRVTPWTSRASQEDV